MKQFDKHAAAYDAIRDKIRYPENLFATLAKQASGSDAAHDIGCGNGVSTIRLKPYFKHVEGSDFSENLIQVAQQKYPDLKFTATAGENLSLATKFDLVTSATSFYWMDRNMVLERVCEVLKPRGIFCAYKYDFPIVYGPLRDFVEKELVTNWSAFRDSRLTQYDDTLDLLRSNTKLQHAERMVFPNIIELEPRELALFFLSASYVTKFLDSTQNKNYPQYFIDSMEKIWGNNLVKVNFDIHAFVATARGS